VAYVPKTLAPARGLPRGSLDYGSARYGSVIDGPGARRGLLVGVRGTIESWRCKSSIQPDDGKGGTSD
jgi:hypothetical protein